MVAVLPGRVADKGASRWRITLVAAIFLALVIGLSSPDAMLARY